MLSADRAPVQGLDARDLYRLGGRGEDPAWMIPSKRRRASFRRSARRFPGAAGRPGQMAGGGLRPDYIGEYHGLAGSGRRHQHDAPAAGCDGAMKINGDIGLIFPQRWGGHGAPPFARRGCCAPAHAPLRIVAQMVCQPSSRARPLSCAARHNPAMTSRRPSSPPATSWNRENAARLSA